jgi:hypothetical protein
LNRPTAKINRSRFAVQRFQGSTRFQCRCGRPPPQAQQEPGLPVQAGASPPASPVAAEAKTENFLLNFFDPQWGQAVPLQLLERTRISLSRAHFSQ